ncbi:type II toxin-antitoxin system YafQ family toxin [Pantoea vagans]|uniref:type II toxin-antitoxin system YafQ family toxin n=1 Tax=Pantoea vagans TaxID=470934 RepID=UPI0028A1ACD2|nr:type II toxin-antitoxin system YafQ family toxin [Pantoea vagans]
MKVRRLSEFKRDIKRVEKRGKDMAKLRAVIMLILSGEPLPAVLKDHPLQGEYRGFRDLHIEPDWLLIYRVEDDALHLARTGTHSDLFK